MEKTEKVLYILGAGFSAPYGLPVMKNFLERSKDMYEANPDKYKDFIGIYNQMNELSLIKNTVHSDLENIENVLSLLEMISFLLREDYLSDYQKYIATVILDSSPKIKLKLKKPHARASHYTDLFDNIHISHLGMFVSNLFKLEYRFKEVTSKHIKNDENYKYAIISLNYDTLIEDIVRELNTLSGEKISLANLDFLSEDHTTLPFIKIHGSAEDHQTILPPTWNKLTLEETRASWTIASKLISQANQIRFIGYSLPESDNYFRYLIKSGVAKSFNLKMIDVLCMDVENVVESRYRELFLKNKVSFNDNTTQTYLNKVTKLNTETHRHQPDEVISMNFLSTEKLHKTQLVWN